MMRAIFHHPCGPWLSERIAALQSDELSITTVPEASGPDLDRALAKTDVLLHVLHPVTAAMMASAPRLKLIQKIGVGLDGIDLEMARARGIAVCNMPGTNTGAVAELTLGLMLSVLRGIPRLDHRLRHDGEWALPPSAQGAFGEIAGKTIGLVGHGHVAQRLAVILDALGAKVLVTTRQKMTPQTGSYASKDALLRRADIVSLHIPETPETQNWLDAAAIARMKQGAIVINTARGALIDEAALARALSSGHLGGAGLDVFAAEPVAADAPILSAPNVVALPHIAWLTRETLTRSLKAARDNINRLSQGRELQNRHA